MVIEVVVCDITENSAGKVQTSDAVLVNGMAAAFHEHISASLIGHTAQ